MSGTAGPAFAQSLARATAPDLRQELAGLLDEVDRAAKRLRAAPAEETLAAYKRSVQTLLRRVMDGLYQLSESGGFDRGGRRRLYLLVRRIDAALEALASDFLRSHRDTLGLAARLDDLRGLLLDLLG